jgi:hypothetical protein
MGGGEEVINRSQVKLRKKRHQAEEEEEEKEEVRVAQENK